VEFVLGNHDSIYDRNGIFLCASFFRMTLEPMKVRVQWVLRSFFQEWLESKADVSPPSFAEVKRLTSALPSQYGVQTDFTFLA
jgi:hypothetical protein